MLDAVLDALIDTAKLLPILFFTYLLMEYLEHHAGSKLGLALSRWQKAGPLLGAGLGLIPPVRLLRRGGQPLCRRRGHHGYLAGRLPGHIR